MERYYNIAGIDVCISGKEEEMYTDERKLKIFRTDKTEDAYRYEFYIVDRLDGPQGECVYQDDSRRVFLEEEKEICYIKPGYRIERIACKTQVQILKEQVPDKITTKIVLNSLGMEQLAVKAGGVVIHASYVVWNGKAIIFTAPSGTGKSTQADLWKEYRYAQIINGDRAIIRINDKQIEACGLPFAGSSEYCRNVTVPVGAIVYLEQGPVCKVERLAGGEAFRSVLEGTSVAMWKRTDVEQVFTIIQEVSFNVPVFRFTCTPDEKAVLALESELRKEW